MKQQALGMVETKGMIGAIEAADIGLKAARVELVGCRKVTGGLVMVAFSGDVASVKAAVETAAAAAAELGQLISKHVIPRPLFDIHLLLNGQVDKNVPEPTSQAGAGEENTEKVQKPDQNLERSASDSLRAANSTGEELEKGMDNQEDSNELYAMTIGALRRLARKTPGIGIVGREISRANKEKLIKEILKARGKGS